jgi:hypothetical protein
LVQSVVRDAQAEMVAALRRKDLPALRRVLHRVHSGYLQPFYRNRTLRQLLQEAEQVTEGLEAAQSVRTAMSDAIASADEEALRAAMLKAEGVCVSVKYARKVLKRLQVKNTGSARGEQPTRVP